MGGLHSQRHSREPSDLDALSIRPMLWEDLVLAVAEGSPALQRTSTYSHLELAAPTICDLDYLTTKEYHAEDGNLPALNHSLLV